MDKLDREELQEMVDLEARALWRAVVLGSLGKFQDWYLIPSFATEVVDKHKEKFRPND